ncbi:unnamed protein product [Symbiodinium sp. CCMP2592]|nr:unnamed protein product [Symbiodinium sp. CCMP2592]
MARWVCFLLIALAAGLRSKSDLAWPWEEHPASSALELQELLLISLAQSSAAEATREEPGDAHEGTLRERIARIRKDWQSASATACHQQLGRLINNLTLACDGLQPKADWILDYYVPAFPNKTCADSVSDIFALGSELVETLRVSRDAVASADVAGEDLRRYQALSFLRSWLVKLTETRHHALLWAGFWDGDAENRTTQEKLSNFAKAIEHATLHPDSFLGQAIEASENLDSCYEDPQTSALAGNMWSIASMSFVLGMREKAQGTVIALVNKQITGERNLSQSVLSTHEIPTLGLAAWGLGFWSPKVLVVDLMGTCDKTSPALQKRLLARLPSWAKSVTNWSPEAFAMRSRLRWQCIDCSGACSLDAAFAAHVEKLVKAKEQQDRKDQELLQVVSPQLARQAATGFRREEVRLADKMILRFSHFKFSRRVNKKMYEHRKALYAEQQVLREKANKLVAGEAHTSQHLRVEQLLHQNADPSSLDRLGRTALMEAAFSGHLKVVEALLKAGVPLEARDERGRTALLWAAGRSIVDDVDALVTAGADLEARDESGETALMFAAQRGSLEVVEVLIRAGAQLEASCRHGTALTVAAEHGRLRVVEVLLKARAHLEAQDKEGNTALMWAAASGHPKVVETLLTAGAQIEARSELGETALTWAVDAGQLQVVEALLKAGAHADALDKKLAQENGHLQIADILCKTIENIKLCSSE